MIAVPFGSSALKKYSALANAGTFLSFVGFSMPTFWLGLILQLVLGVYLTSWAGVRIFTPLGCTDGGFVDVLQHLALQSLSVVAWRSSAGSAAPTCSPRLLRTACAKGLPQRSVYLKRAPGTP